LLPARSRRSSIAGFIIVSWRLGIGGVHLGGDGRDGGRTSRVLLRTRRAAMTG
jgi:hypothetical protein